MAARREGWYGLCSRRAVTLQPPNPESMRPIGFHGRCGWLHAADWPAGLGVVICSPLGRDARCVHLPMRLFAEQLARAGVPTLRYDHADTGDSLDLPQGDDALPVWLADVQRAVATLRALTGVERVVLCGARLGATFAAAAAEGMDGLILLGPVVSGRSWTSKAAFAARTGTAAAGERQAAGPLDTDGMLLSPATVRSLAGLDMLRIATTPSRVLIFTHGKTTDAYVRHLVQSGADVVEAPFAGHADLFLESHSNLVPQATFDRALTWLADTFLDSGAKTGPAAIPAQQDASAVVTSALRPADAVEQLVRFGPGLHGVFSTPTEGRGDGRVVLFCNTGGDPRAGIGRLAVQAGRKLARQGVASLRFDFAGLGDSPMASGEPRSHVYERDRREDMEAALTFLETQGFTRVLAFGICSGAYHALHAAFRDPRICGVFAVNPLRLVWRGEEISFGERPAAYVDKLGDPATWTRLLAGRIQLAAVGRALISQVRTRVAARIGSGPARSLRRSLARLSARDARLHLLVGADDAALDEVQAYLGPRGEHLVRLPGMLIQIEPGLDHGLSRSASRETALDALWRWLDLPRPSPHDGDVQSCEREGVLV